MKQINPLEQQILDALNELDSAVQRMSTSQPKPNLMPLFERLDSLTDQLPRGSNPELSHYLAKKSYEKARLLLAGASENIPKGSCR